MSAIGPHVIAAINLVRMFVRVALALALDVEGTLLVVGHDDEEQFGALHIVLARSQEPSGRAG